MKPVIDLCLDCGERRHLIEGRRCVDCAANEDDLDAAPDDPTLEPVGDAKQVKRQRRAEFLSAGHVCRGCTMPIPRSRVDCVPCERDKLQAAADRVEFAARAAALPSWNV